MGIPQPTQTRTALLTTAAPQLLGIAAALVGVAAWFVFLRADLVLSHYDAKAHLVVARRVLDSITPGWQQFGGVWLPLPHLIQFIPVQIDFFYRTGVFASFVSIVCFGLTAYATARLVIALTGSKVGAATSTAILALNPNLLYLQATPMTEPLLLATLTLAVLWLFEWVEAGAEIASLRLRLALFAAMWTRYEAWPVIAAALAAAAYVMWRQGRSGATAITAALRLAAWPAAAVLAFIVNSRISTGAWFVSDGFYVPDPTYQGQAWRSVVSIWWGTHELSGYTTEVVAILAAFIVLYRACARRTEAVLLIPIAFFAAAALPFYAFYEAHPYRIRYMVPMVAACALFAGVATGLARRGASILSVLLIIAALVESPPWDRRAPMLLEAQWDRPASRGRRAVTACLATEYDGGKILVSMGSLAHYLQELSNDRFAIADFVHEGNGRIWNAALETGPAPLAAWMLVEEQAEGGDVLAQRVRREPAFTRGMTRVCEGGGVALYKRASGG